MTAQTNQRIDNRHKIVTLALKLYDAKPNDKAKRDMLAGYADHIAYTQTLKGQREWLEILEAKVRDLEAK